MVIIKKLAAELEVQPAVKPLHPLQDFSGLLRDVFFVVETDFSPSSCLLEPSER